MIRKSIISAAALGVAALAMTNVSQAFFGNMMNPSRWFNDDDDYYRRGGYGRYGPYGGYGGPYGGYGWGGPYGPYGGYGYGYGQPSTIVVNPSEGSKQAPPRMPD